MSNDPIFFKQIPIIWKHFLISAFQW